MLFNPFKKGGGGKKKSSLERILDRLVDMDPNSANCTLIKTPDGLELDEDLERAVIFKYEDRVLTQNKAFYIVTPDGTKAEDKSLFTGKGEILNLWFLYNQVPHSVDCRVMGRIRFSDELLPELTPRIPVGYMLKPVGNIRKMRNANSFATPIKSAMGTERSTLRSALTSTFPKPILPFRTQGRCRLISPNCRPNLMAPMTNWWARPRSRPSNS